MGSEEQKRNQGLLIYLRVMALKVACETMDMDGFVHRKCA